MSAFLVFSFIIYVFLFKVSLKNYYLYLVVEYHKIFFMHFFVMEL